MRKLRDISLRQDKLDQQIEQLERDVEFLQDAERHREQDERDRKRRVAIHQAREDFCREAELRALAIRALRLSALQQVLRCTFGAHRQKYNLSLVELALLELYRHSLEWDEHWHLKCIDSAFLQNDPLSTLSTPSHLFIRKVRLAGRLLKNGVCPAAQEAIALARTLWDPPPMTLLYTRLDSLSEDERLKEIIRHQAGAKLVDADAVVDTFSHARWKANKLREVRWLRGLRRRKAAPPFGSPPPPRR